MTTRNKEIISIDLFRKAGEKAAAFEFESCEKCKYIAESSKLHFNLSLFTEDDPIKTSLSISLN